MNRTDVKQILDTNITALSDFIEVIKLIRKESESYTHYKNIDGRYFNGLTKAIPVKKTYYNEWQKRNIEVRDYYIKEYNYSDYIPFEITSNVDYKTRLSAEDTRTVYNRTLTVFLDRETRPTPENVPLALDKLLNQLNDELDELIKYRGVIDEVIDSHNKAVELLESLKNNELSNYTVKSCMPKVSFPYVHDSFYIKEN